MCAKLEHLNVSVLGALLHLRGAMNLDRPNLPRAGGVVKASHHSPAGLGPIVEL
jgi:hypothetical protein